MIAKIELWIKGRIGRATRWFVFDQVDFNSTVYQVLGELRAAQVRQERIISAFQATTRLEASERALEQRTINEEQRIVNEDLRVFQEEQRVSDEEVRLLLEELRRQINESAVTIDRMRRNFEHRLGEIEHRGPEDHLKPRSCRYVDAKAITGGNGRGGAWPLRQAQSDYRDGDLAHPVLDRQFRHR